MSGINPISNPMQIVATPELNKAGVTPASAAQDFGAILQKAIAEVNGYQKEAELLQTKLVTGEISDLHTVMIAAEKANVSLQFAVQVRNKVVEAYQEIMRMQV